MRRETLIAHVRRHGAWLHDQQPRSEVYATSALHMAGIPMRPDIGIDNVIGICRALDIPVPAGVQQRRRRAKVIRKTEMVLQVPADSMVLVIPREGVRTAKRAAARRGRKRNSRE